jgi:RNA polymerase sigma-70 factor (ECF subfamily)
MNALSERIEQFIPALRRYAWALARNSDDADDLVQDCLEKALRGASSLRQVSDLRPWLFSILHNVFISERRRLARRGVHVAIEVAGEPAVDGGQNVSMDANDVLGALAKLSLEQRQVLLLVAVEDLSYEETSSVLRIPIGTVMSRLSRARERLRDLIDRPDQERLRIVT